jgi:NitT/TauT family transport system substrate-binding protein
MAATGGLFSAEGLAVTINIASGSPDAIARVAAGTSDFALVDINALVRFRDKDKQGVPPVKAVSCCSTRAPYAIIARKSRGIQALSDMEGKNLGVAEGDLSIRLWPAVASRTASRSPASSRAASAPRCASRCCRRARSTPSPDFLSVGDQS